MVPRQHPPALVARIRASAPERNTLALGGPLRARWDQELVRMGEQRLMQVESADLPAQVEVIFTVSQERYGEIGEAQVVSQQGYAEAPWDNWYDLDWVTDRQALDAGEEFPVVQFTFTARVKGQEVRCEAPLRYEDRLHGVLNLSGGDSLPNREYVLYSPWGLRRGTCDEQGLLTEERLPPGGVTLVLDDSTLIHQDHTP